MASTFTTIQTNISNNVQDTSNEMKTLIGVYINNRYRDTLRRVNWEAVNLTYSFNTVAGQALYTMPSDFKKEIYAYNSTNTEELSRITLQEYVSNYRTNNVSNDVPNAYMIVDQVLATTNERYKLLKLVNTPADAYTIELPYTIEPTDLSGSVYPIISCEQALEYGATADAQRYKRQFAKAADYEKMYEMAINTLVWDYNNQPNQVNMTLPTAASRETV